MNDIKKISKELCELCNLDVRVNFGEPKNFVKLLELKIDDTCTLWDVFDFFNDSGGIHDRKDFLNELLFGLSGYAERKHRDDMDEYIDKIKKAIKENWRK